MSAIASVAMKKIRDIPLPREHGSWVILYAPVIIATFRAESVQFLPLLLLVCAITGAFLSRHAAVLILRGKGSGHVMKWLAGYLIVTISSGGYLIFNILDWRLIGIFLAAVGLFTMHTWLATIPSRKRMDRTIWGEMLGIAALCLTGPAGWIVLTGHAPVEAWLEWAVCLLFFGSGIFHVKMLLESGKLARSNTPESRRRIIGPSRLYHLLLPPLLILLAPFLGLREIWMLLAFLPILYRAWRGILHLQYRIPSFKQVGYMETLYSAWFILCIIL